MVVVDEESSLVGLNVDWADLEVLEDKRDVSRGSDEE